MRWEEKIDRAVDRLFPEMVQVRRHLHRFPEVGGREVATTRYLEGRCREAGFETRKGTEGLGLIVDALRPGREPSIGLRADIDAVAIQDTKEVAYGSQARGVMHACGHDAHAATVLGAVLALADAEKSGALPWPLCWRAIFQPAEELNRGALDMVSAGALKGVRALLAVHVDPTRPAGEVGLQAGRITAECAEIEIAIQGRGGHAARPHEARDPIAVGAQLIGAIYQFIPRAVTSHDPVIVTFGQIEGADNPNVIPDVLFLRGTLRTLSTDLQRRTMDHVRKLARGLAEASETRIDIDFKVGPPSVHNDPELTGLFRDCAVDLLGEEKVSGISRPSMGGEDFANYLGHVPGSLLRLGCARDDGRGPSLHASEFDIDEQAMRIGAKILARAVVKYWDPVSCRAQGGPT